MYSRLDIINAMVVSTGARPLTAEQSNHPLYTKAENKLDNVLTSTLSRGLWFNTECRTIAQQSDGTVVVPQDCIKADPTDRNFDLTLRGRRMYNLTVGTFEVGCDVELNMFFTVPLEYIPVEAKAYLQAKAVYEFYLDEDGADPKLSNYRNERDLAWTALYKEHLRNRQVNVFDNQSNAVSRLRRGVTASGSNTQSISWR